MKKKLLTLLFIAINVGVIIITAIAEFSDHQGATKFLEIRIRWGYAIPAIACLLGSIAIIMKKLCGRVDWYVARRTFLLGKYYDNITPSAVGGEPFQIYYLKQHGYNGSDSAAMTTISFLASQFAFLVIALIVYIFFRDLMISDLLRISGYIGLFVFAVPPLALLISMYLPKAFSAVLSWGVKLLSNLHLLKNPDKKIQEVTESVHGCSDSVKMVLGHQGLLISVLLLGGAFRLLTMFIPYFVVKGFGGSITFLQAFVTTVTIYCAITYIPTPGNAGAAEGAFYVVFSMLTAGHIFWAMLGWRLFAYYIYLIIGMIIYIRKWWHRKKREKAGIPKAAPIDRYAWKALKENLKNNKNKANS